MGLFGNRIKCFSGISLQGVYCDIVIEVYGWVSWDHGLLASLL